MKALRAIDFTGERLDADFHVEPTSSGFDLIMESRSGRTRGAHARNPDYERLFELLLRRAAVLDATLLGAWVESEYTAHLDAGQRLLHAEGFPYPVNLPQIANFRTLRVMLSRPQGGIGRREGARGPGNRNKRIRLSCQTSEAWTEGNLADALASGELVRADTELRGALYDEEGEPHPRLDFAKIQKTLEKYEDAPPGVRQRVGQQIERGPIGELVKAANGRRCQVCVAFGRDGKGFRRRDGNHYIEAHHVELVSSNAIGVLRLANVVTLCANHHREMHYGAKATMVDVGDHFIVTVEQGNVRIEKSSLFRSGEHRQPIAAIANRL